jgi:hypothetical protein
VLDSIEEVTLNSWFVGKQEVTGGADPGITNGMVRRFAGNSGRNPPLLYFAPARAQSEKTSTPISRIHNVTKKRGGYTMMPFSGFEGKFRSTPNVVVHLGYA